MPVEDFVLLAITGTAACSLHDAYVDVSPSVAGLVYGGRLYLCRATVNSSSSKAIPQCPGRAGVAVYSCAGSMPGPESSTSLFLTSDRSAHG